MIKKIVSCLLSILMMVTLSPVVSKADDCDVVFELNSANKTWDYIKWGDTTKLDIKEIDQTSDSFNGTLTVKSRTDFSILLKDEYINSRSDSFKSIFNITITNLDGESEYESYTLSKGGDTSKVFSMQFDKGSVDAILSFSISHDYSNENEYITNITITDNGDTIMNGLNITSNSDGILWADSEKNSLELNVEAVPSHSSYQEIEWICDNEEVVSITSNGKTATVTALKEGTANITVKATNLNGKEITSDPYSVTVKTFSISSSRSELYINGFNDEKSLTLTASISPEMVGYDHIEWTNNSPDVVYMTTDGTNATITEISKGNVDITATLVLSDGSKVTANFNTEVKSHHIVYSKTIDVGSELEINPKNSSLNDTWESSDKSIATVRKCDDYDKKQYPLAYVTGVNPGTAIIRHTALTLSGWVDEYYEVTVTGEGNIKSEANLYVLANFDDDPDGDNYIQTQLTVYINSYGLTDTVYDAQKRLLDWNSVLDSDGKLDSGSYLYGVLKSNYSHSHDSSTLESITFIPYKITVNEDGTYNIYCKTSISIKDKATVNFFAQIPGTTGFKQVSSSTQDIKSSISAPTIDETKIVDGLTYKFNGWYTDSSCSGDKVDFNNYTLTSNTNFYAAYEYLPRTIQVECYIGSYKLKTETYETNEIEAIVTAPEIQSYTPKGDSTQTVTTKEGETVTVKFEYCLAITLTGTYGTFTYDGQEHYVAGYQNSTVYQFDDPIEIKRTETEAGEYEVEVSKDYIGKVDKTGRYKVVAVKNGKLTITKADGLIVTGTSSSKEYDGTPLSAAVSSNKDGTTFLYSIYDEEKGEWGEYIEDIPTLTDAGSIKVKAMGINPNYASVESDPFTLTITSKPITVTFEGIEDTIVYDGRYHTLQYTVSAVDKDGNTVGYTKDDYVYSPSSGKQIVSKKDVGSYTMGFQANEFSNNNKNYDVTFEVINKDVEIVKRDVTLYSNSKTCTYSGQECTYNSAYASNFASGEGVTFNVTGSQTEVGSSENTFTYELTAGTNKDNYNIKIEYGTITVDPKEVTITALNASKLVGEDDPQLNVNIDGMIAGESTDLIKNNIKVSREEGETSGAYKINVTDLNGNTENVVIGNYKLLFKSGIFTITGKDDMTVEPDLGLSVSKEYDGTILDGKAHSNVSDASISYSHKKEDGTWSDYGEEIPSIKDVGTLTIKAKATANGFNDAYSEEYNIEITPRKVSVRADNLSKVYKENDPKLTASFEGTLNEDTISYNIVREEGEDAGTYRITVSGDSLQGNYKVTYYPGTFTIYPSEEEVIISIIGNSYEFTYTGKEHTLSGYSVSYSKVDTGITVDLIDDDSAMVKGTNAGTYYMNLSESLFKINHKNYSNVTVEVEDGYMVINKATNLSLITNDISKVYDGEALKVEATSLTSGTTIYYSVNGERWYKSVPTLTNVGTRTIIAKAVNPNYEEVTSTYTIEVTKRPITFRGKSASVIYTGETQTVEGYDIYNGSLANGDEAKLTASASGIEKGDYTGTITSSSEVKIAGKYGDVTNNYDIITIPGTLHIGGTSINEASVTGIEDKSYDGKIHKCVPVVKINNETLKEGADYTVEYSTYDFVNSGNITVTIYGVGDYYGTITKSYKIIPSDEEIKISVKGLNDHVTYNGDMQSIGGYTIEGIEGTDITVEYNSYLNPVVSGIDAGTYYMGLSEESFIINHNNYANVDVEVVDGYLEITPKDIVPTEIGGVKVDTVDDVLYNGKSQTQKVIVYDSKLNYLLKEDVDYRLEYSDNTTNAGVVGVDIIGIGNYGVETNVQYNILQRRITITTGSDEKEYDGTALTNNEVMVKGDGFIEGEVTKIRSTGSQTYVGQSLNTYKMTTSDKYNADNYIITENLGTLKVTEASSPITGYINKDAISYKAPKGEILNSVEELSNLLLNDNEKELISKGYKGSIVLEVYGGSYLDTYKEDIDAVKNNLNGYSYGTAYSIELLKRINEETTYINNTDTPITIKMNLEDSLINTNSHISRGYRIIRVHHEDDQTIVDNLPVTLNSDNSITFEADKFSIYAIVYKDTNKDDGVVTCEDQMGKGWIWSETKKACVYKISNTNVK